MSRPNSSNYVTRSEFEQAMERIDARFDRFEERMDARFDRFEERFDAKLAVLDARVEGHIEKALVTSIRWTVGLAFGQYALMFGLILFVVSRELAHP
ncbi:MAG: hypothetical protein JOZ65_03970 [Chloroflexi bacterium]|nr:hypothetical protein [Chloroflexota bacterium]